MSPALPLLCLLLCCAQPVAAETLLGHFSARDLTGWQSKRFQGETRYDWAMDGARPVLRGVSEGSASGLVREQAVDLAKTPFLTWRWRVDRVLRAVNETTRAGDDYPARLYVIFSGGALFWRSRAINYVWSSRQPVGSHWPNAFTNQAVMLAVASGPNQVGQWLTHKRNVREDYRQLFGEDIQQVDAVALMTDTDNSGQSATAWYGDIYFTAD